MSHMVCMHVHESHRQSHFGQGWCCFALCGRSSVWSADWYLQATKLEVSMNAVERVMEYSNQQPEGSNQGQCMQPPSDWPQSGAIAIKNLQVRYLQVKDKEWPQSGAIAVHIFTQK